MAYAQEMKNLVADIKTGHRDRTARIREIKRETRDILGEADDYMERVAADLKEAAKALRDFLAKSEERRIADFKALMKDVARTVEAIEKSTKALLNDYKAERKEAAGYWASLTKKGVAPAVKVKEVEEEE